MNQLEAMLLSMAIEMPVAYTLVSWCDWPCRGPASVALSVALATAASHPQLWTASIWLYPRIGYEPAVLLTESAVILIEACIIQWCTGLLWRQSILTSALANGASAVVGLALALSI